MGARIPILCIMPSILCTLYVSVERRETRDGTVSASVCFAESDSVLENRSARMRSVVSRATLEAKRFAITLPAHATTATSSIPTLHSESASTLLVGTTSSIMCAMMRGRKSSATVPTTLKIMPAAMRPLLRDR